MNKFKQGEVLEINLGEIGTNAIVGHEQGKTRPCLVIKSLHQIGLLIIVPFSSKKPKRISYFHVKVEKGKANLKYDSYVLCHQIRTISVGRVITKIGNLPAFDLNKVQDVIIDLISNN